MKVKMKLFKVLTMVAFAGSIVSCSKEMSTEDIQQINGKVETKSISNPLNVLEISKLVSYIEKDDAILEEVRTGVERSLKYGLGETYRFNDILEPQESKLVRTLDLSSSFADALKNTYSNLREEQSIAMSNDDFFTILGNSNFMIRWPYFENWNGVDKPIVGFASEDGTELYSPKLNLNGTFSIDTILVSDEYLKENPVWLITESSLSYDELPDFENGEFVNKNGTFFYSDYAVEKRKSKRTTLERKGLYIENICFKETYESAIKGNGEIEFLWQSLPNGIGRSQNIMHYTITSGKLNDELQVDWSVSNAWTDNQELDNGLVVLEKDGGKDKTGVQHLRYGNLLSGNVRTIEVSFSYEKRDEIIMNYGWGKDLLCTDSNIAGDGKPKKYYGLHDNFWITFRFYE